MSAAKSGKESPIDPRWIGLIDARESGWFVNERNELFRGFPVGPDEHVLDVGCGDGAMTMYCAERGAHVLFTDIEAESVEGVKQQVSAQGKAASSQGFVCDSDPLLVPDACATRVICREVLEHVEDPSQVMGELVRAGKPGALYLLTVPGETGEKIQQKFAPSSYFEHPNHIRIFSEQDFTSLVEDAGLEILEYSANGFFWVFWMSMHWILEAEKQKAAHAEGIAVHATIKPPFDPLMHMWAQLWHALIGSPEGLAFKKQLDALIPKNQVIIARKKA